MSVIAEKGERVDMQDEHLVMQEYTQALTNNQSGEAYAPIYVVRTLDNIEILSLL